MRYKSYSACDSQGQSQIKEIYETSFPKSENYEGGCSYCTGIGCECYEDLFLRKEK